MKNTKIILAKRPIGYPTLEDFEIIKSDQELLKANQVSIRTLFLSLDPYMRGRMTATKSYAKNLEIGEVMTGEIIGIVENSSSENIPEGSIVLSKSGWQSNPIVNQDQVSIIDSRIDPITLALGAIGMPGLTAYFGLTKIGKPKPGETVVVSAGSGAVGATVGQIAKSMGCRVIGIAGSKEKINYMTENLGFDEGINYKESDWIENFKRSCKEGVDIYFDNVGGSISDYVIDEINDFARVIVCGQISQYNNSELELGPRNMHKFLIKQAKLEGFIVFRWENQYKDGIEFLLNLKETGLLKYKETIVEGIENAPETFLKLFSGENFGKLLIKVN